MTLKSAFYTFLLSAAGMIVGYQLTLMGDRLLPSAFAYDSTQVLSSKGFELVDDQGRRQILIGTTDSGVPAIWFFDRNGKNRLNLGIYDDGNAAVVLNDENEQAVQIFRTIGSQNLPVLVMKSGGRDRIIMGLDGAEAAPFLVLYDNKGTKTTVAGTYGS